MNEPGQGDHATPTRGTRRTPRNRAPQRAQDQCASPKGGQPHGNPTGPPDRMAHPDPPQHRPNETTTAHHTHQPPPSHKTQARDQHSKSISLTSANATPSGTRGCDDPPHTTAQEDRAQHNATQHSTAHRNAAHDSAAERGTAPRDTAQHSTTRHGTAQQGATRHSTRRHNTARRGTAQHGRAGRSAAQRGAARRSTAKHKTPQHRTPKHTPATRQETLTAGLT